MGLALAIEQGALERFLASAAAADRVAIRGIAALSGGTVHENWLLDAMFEGGPQHGEHKLVLRTDCSRSVCGSLSRCDEFAVMRAARAAGVRVPEPLWASGADGPLGREFLVMRWMPGTASAAAIIHDPTLGGAHDKLAERLGEELARLQRVGPATLDAPGVRQRIQTPERIIRELRDYLDTLGQPHPTIEWGLRWLERHAPPPAELVLTHGDFRTGNYLVDAHGLTAILDWELAGFGDPLADLGWFCMRCWRLDAPDKVAGGLAGREAILGGYERERGRPVDRRALAYWEIMANVRWAVISIQQAERHLSGADPSLELCLTGCMTAEMEYEALRLIAAHDEEAAGHA